MSASEMTQSKPAFADEWVGQWSIHESTNNSFHDQIEKKDWRKWMGSTLEMIISVFYLRYF